MQKIEKKKNPLICCLLIFEQLDAIHNMALTPSQLKSENKQTNKTKNRSSNQNLLEC